MEKNKIMSLIINLLSAYLYDTKNVQTLQKLLITIKRGDYIMHS
ncbi:hypothetical protein GMMP1_1480018 [Candidatus Magnetomoraceae bacterium gMMP-1]